MANSFMKYVTWYLVLAMVVIGITPRVYAGFSPSGPVGFPPIDRASDLESIQNAIETKMVGERLKQIGLTPDEIQKKLNQLSDQQIHQLALQLEELKVGGDAGWVVLGVIIVLAAIGVLVINLLGYDIVII